MNLSKQNILYRSSSRSTVLGIFLSNKAQTALTIQAFTKGTISPQKLRLPLMKAHIRTREPRAQQSHDKVYMSHCSLLLLHLGRFMCTESQRKPSVAHSRNCGLPRVTVSMAVAL